MAAPPGVLAGRSVLVTGAARGIGRAVALGAAAAGARVYAVDRLQDELAEVSGLLGPGHHVRTFDLSDTEGIAGLCADAAAALGGLDGLAHVAGVIVRRADLDLITADDWDLQVGVNLKATFFLNREAARQMPAGSAIVNFSSQGWWTGGFGGSVVYAATKGGVVSLTRGLARSYASRGIRINCVAPGGVDTAMMNDGLDEQARQDFLAQIPAGRLARPDELADAVTYLLSEQSSYVTGTVLNVSGGQLVY